MCHLKCNGIRFWASTECGDALDQANTREYDQVSFICVFLDYQTNFVLELKEVLRSFEVFALLIVSRVNYLLEVSNVLLSVPVRKLLSFGHVLLKHLT